MLSTVYSLGGGELEFLLGQMLPFATELSYWYLFDYFIGGFLLNFVRNQF